MIHGFLILTHVDPGKVLAQVTRMTNANRRFFIHFDQKRKLDDNDPALKKLQAMPNVAIMSERVNVQWASFRMVEATLILIRAAVAHKDIDYLHLISGECLPVKSSRSMDDFLQGGKREYIQYFPVSEATQDGWGSWRYDRYNLHEYFNPRSKALKDVFIRTLNFYLLKGQGALKRLGIFRKFPKGFPRLYGGSQWWTLSYACCAYFLEYIEREPGFVSRFRHTSCSDEFFFQTLIMASPFAEHAVNNNLRYIVFSDGPHAGALTLNDAEALSAPEILIARKFTSGSDALLNYLETGPLTE